MADNYEFLIRAALGQGDNAAVNKFGYVDGLVGVAQTIWSEGGTYVYPSAAATMNVSSSDANDAFGGSGAQQVEVMGLDADYVEQIITVDLNGQTYVPLVPALIRVNRVKVIGSIDAVGDVYVGNGTNTAGVPVNVYAKVEIGENQTLQAVYTVPATKQVLVFLFSASSAKNEEVTVSLKARELGGVFQTKDKLDIYQNSVPQPYPVPLVFPPKTDIELRAIGTAVAARVSGKFTVVLIPA